MRSAASISASTRARCVGLIGDNGAGKSTLIKILAGVVKPTSGEILVRGQPVSGWNAANSREAGIETVFQDRALAVQQTIVRNIFMGRELKGPLGWLNIAKEEREAARLMREIGFTSAGFHAALDRRPAFGRRAPGRRHRPRHLQACRSHHPRRADNGVVDHRNQQGVPFRAPGPASACSIIFISHNIHHVYDIADRFVVLDRGKVALEAKRAEVPSAEALMSFMEAGRNRTRSPIERLARTELRHDRRCATRKSGRRCD